MYPQPQASTATVGGQDSFRLYTQLESPGDIYEINTGCLGLALGPNSDISLIRATYYDILNTTLFSNSAIISPDRSLIGRRDASDQPYPNTGSKQGRILITCEDLYNPYYQPTGFDGSNDVIKFLTPSIDLIAYFGAPPSLIPQRSDRRFYFEYYPAPKHIGDDAWIMVPYWGRKYADIDINNKNASSIVVEIRGINFCYVSTGSPPVFSAEETVLSASAAVVAGGSRRVKVRASADGMFDMLAIKYQPTAAIPANCGPIPTHITTSDDAL